MSRNDGEGEAASLLLSLASMAGCTLNGEAAELELLPKRAGAMVAVKSASDRAVFAYSKARAVVLHGGREFWSKEQAWRQARMERWDKAAEARAVLGV